jgi:hypothetical protein
MYYTLQYVRRSPNFQKADRVKPLVPSGWVHCSRKCHHSMYIVNLLNPDDGCQDTFIIVIRTTCHNALSWGSCRL